MPVRLVIRNFPPHVDADAASAYVAQAMARGAPVRCETLYYRRGKPKTKRGVRLGSLYVEGDNDEALAEQLARAGPPPPPPPPPSDETQPPPPPSKRPPVPLVVERAAFDRVFRAPTRPDRRAGTWLESPEYAAFKAYDPRQARPKTKRDTPVALLDGATADTSGVVPVYMGDDTTDEDAFAVLQGLGGLSFLVTTTGDPERPRDTFSTHTVASYREVEQLLGALAEIE